MTTDFRSRLQCTLGDAYILGRELGGGGMSRVFIVEDATLRRSIVVKVLPPEMAAEVSIARFQREIALAARLQHPHIVPLLATGETQGLPYFTMPFVEGESLRERLARDGALPVDECVRLLREIASALAYAHEKGIVHRDIKPDNVLLSRGIALVTDFGVAKALLSSSTAGRGPLTSVGIAVGTPAYMSPEQISADPATDHRADLYAFGMIAYEMLAGQPPFAGRTAHALLAAHVIDAPEPLQQRRRSVPPALAALVMRCIEKRPADRPQHASEIVQALDAMTTSTQAVLSPRLSLKRPSRARLVALALLVIVAAAGAWLSLRGRSPAGAAPASRLLIAPFENLTGDPRFDHIGRIAADRLALLVAQTGSLDVVPSSTVLMALRDTTGAQAERLSRLSEATHAGLLVSGTVLLRRDSLVLQAQATEVRTGKVVLTLEPASGAAADPIAAVDALGDRLLGALGSREVAIQPKGFRAPRYAAYQAFAAGYERFAVQGDFVGSRPFFERAIAIDSTYARAYLLLARQYVSSEEFARADAMARRIERLPQGVNAFEQLQVDYLRADLSGNLGGMLRAQQQLVARDSSALALALVGRAANDLLRPGLAIPALEHSEAPYLLMGGFAARDHTYLLAEAYHEAGLYDRELDELVARQALFSGDATFRGRALRAYAGLKQGVAAVARADTLLRGSGDSAEVVLRLVAAGAQEFRAHGDAGTAARLITVSRVWLGAHPARVPSPDRRMQEGIIMLASGMLDSAATRFSLAARDTNRIAAAGYLALCALARGNRGRARAIADSIGGIRRPWLFGVHTFWRAAIIGALGERDQAVQLLHQANREGQPMQSWHYIDALVSLHGYPAFEALIRPQR